ncbi:MAG: hypothetical protein IJJ71_09460 [Treponema sp.]|uniref:hypothetical protein n=1 Tax=Treponema sp. TaxID=166 RepID=UPI0025F64249|nr:hypothetical protein [Treponema sp.]MBQ9622297.1 hypothetical protein [Treponema sp.]MBR0099599.1 hypothetical protein [Treponema sp.]MBR0496386.1 hypothetical protein [Treponema sp.]
MTETEIIFFIIKLFLGGVIAFLAIMLWSRTRDFSWMFLVFAAVTGYSSIVFDLLLRLGFVTAREISILGNEIPLVQLVLAIVPGLFVIMAFILMLIKTGRK